MKKLAGDKAKLVDLGGRTVIPGLTDGHIHGIRAALTCFDGFGTAAGATGSARQCSCVVMEMGDGGLIKKEV